MSAMKHYSCWIILYLPIFAGLILPLDADSEDYDCTVQIKVRRHTVYNAMVGQELKIKCTVSFCNYPPAKLTWEKVGEIDFPVDVSRDSHIKTEWKHVNKLEGIYYLIFTKILQSDAGQYQCGGGHSFSHLITVSVHDHGEITMVTQTNAADHSKLTTATWTTAAAESVTPADAFWPFVYRAVGTLLFVIIVILICITAKRGCKGKLRKTTRPSEELPHHVYDNDV